MRVLRGVAFVVVTIVLSCAPHRDLSQYVDGGSFDFAQHPVTLDAHHSVGHFLLGYFRERRRARVRVTAYSIEGVPSETTWFVEPDSRGQWHVVEHWHRSLLEDPGRLFAQDIVFDLAESPERFSEDPKRDCETAGHVILLSSPGVETRRY